LPNLSKNCALRGRVGGGICKKRKGGGGKKEKTIRGPWGGVGTIFFFLGSCKATQQKGGGGREESPNSKEKSQQSEKKGELQDGSKREGKEKGASLTGREEFPVNPLKRTERTVFGDQWGREKKKEGAAATLPLRGSQCPEIELFFLTEGGETTRSSWERKVKFLSEGNLAKKKNPPAGGGGSPMVEKKKRKN